MMNALFTGLMLITAVASAKVSTSKIGTINYGDIIRTVDLQKKEVCFIVSGGENGDIACVTRDVAKAPTFLKVGQVDHDSLITLSDDALHVTCTVARFYQGAKIRCQ